MSPHDAQYAEFVSARWSALYRTAYLLTGAHADAEDLLQTALVKVYAAWPKVRRVDQPEAYVRKMVLNAFISSRRTLRWKRERLTEAPPDLAAAGVEGLLDERLMLWPQVAELPPRQRAVIVLRYYEDLSEKQIAAALGCSVGTVKSTASDALKSLRKRIGANDEEGVAR